MGGMEGGLLAGIQGSKEEIEKDENEGAYCRPVRRNRRKVMLLQDQRFKWPCVNALEGQEKENEGKENLGNNNLLRQIN